MPAEFFDVEQGSAEWHELRRGIPTASMFKVLLVENDTKAGRTTYLHKLAGERITGVPATSFVNEYMEGGKVAEPEIRRQYAFLRDCEPQQVGFVRNGKAGASPDSMVGDDGLMEAKKAEPHILIPMQLKLRDDPKYFPREHYAQCQGNLWIAEAEWIDLIVWAHPKMQPLIARAYRDEPYIQKLRDAVDLFDLELRRLVEKLK
jgi:hypothetical protein